MVIYMYIAPGWGQMSPWGPISFRIINIQSYCPFPALATYVDLAVKKDQGHHICSGEEDFEGFFTIYGHRGHLGHVTWIIYIHIDYPFLLMLHIKFGFDLPSGFRGDDV